MTAATHVRMGMWRVSAHTTAATTMAEFVWKTRKISGHKHGNVYRGLPSFMKAHLWSCCISFFFYVFGANSQTVWHVIPMRWSFFMILIRVFIGFFLCLLNRFACVDIRSSKHTKQVGEFPLEVLSSLCQHCANSTATAECESIGDRSTNTSVLRVKVALSTHKDYRVTNHRLLVPRDSDESLTPPLMSGIS